MPLQEELEQQGNWLFKYRGILPLTILGVAAILYIRTELYPETFFLEGTIYEVYFEMLSFVISLLGLGIRAYTVGHTPKNTSGRNTKEGQVADMLNTTGMYSIVRHPLYLGNFFMWLGPAMLTGQFWFIVTFCLFYWIYYERIMFAEEQFLRRKFGDTYLSWAKTVPAFIPKFKKIIKPEFDFSWRKVLIKEKTGFLALFSIFFLFDLIGELIENKSNYNYFTLIGFLFSLLFYATIKYLSKKSSFLDDSGR